MRKNLQEAYSDIAAFMYGKNWYESYFIKEDVFTKQKYLKFSEMIPVFKKLAEVSSKNSKFFGGFHYSEVFENIVDDIALECQTRNLTIEEAIVIRTAERMSEFY